MVWGLCPRFLGTGLIFLHKLLIECEAAVPAQPGTQEQDGSCLPPCTKLPRRREPLRGSMVSLSVDVLNGATCPTTTTVTLDTGDSLLVLKKRLCAATGLPATTLKLCCAGKVLLDDDQRIGSLPSTRLTAWGPRSTRFPG